MKVYIVKGLCISEDDIFAIISEYGVQKTLKGAKKELENTYNEIIEMYQENEIEIIENNYYKDGFVVTNENDETYTFKIEERTIQE